MFRLGNALKKGDDLYYYLVDCEGRKGLLIFLDEKERPIENELNLTKISLKSPKKATT